MQVLDDGLEGGHVVAVRPANRKKLAVKLAKLHQCKYNKMNDKI